jgi:hypothetical protein
MSAGDAENCTPNGHETELEGGFLAAAVPHRSRSNLSAAWQICGKFLTPPLFAEPRAATSPSPFRRNENLRKAALPPVCRKTFRRS